MANLSFSIFLGLNFILVIRAVTVDVELDSPFPVNEGTNLSFTCIVTGVPSLVAFKEHVPNTIDIVAWKFNDADKTCARFGTIPPERFNITESCDAQTLRFTMQILNIPESLNGENITCEVTDTLSQTIEEHVLVDIHVPLTSISTNGTENITIVEQTTVNVSCTARSRPAAHIDWYIDGDVVNDNHTIMEDGLYVTSILHYTGNKSDNGRRLYCVATSGNYNAQSADMFLNVEYSPLVAVRTSSTPVEGIQHYNLTCTVLDSNPMPNNFSWLIGNTSISGERNDVLSFLVLNRSDSENYTCHSTNGIGTAMDTLYMDVLYKGQILYFNVSNSSVTEGSFITSHAEVEGKPLPNVTWSYDRTDSVLLFEPGVNMSKLNISVHCQDTGNYTLTVDNGLINQDTRKIRVEVPCKPRIDSSSGTNNEFTVEYGGPLKMEASFVAFPKPSVTWYFRASDSQINTSITSNENVAIAHSGDEAVHKSTMQIQRADSSHSGRYFVFVENDMGSNVQMFSVVITEPGDKVNVEAVAAGVLGAVAFIIVVGCVVNCYRKKKRKEKRRQRAWMTNNKDIDDIIKENPIEDVERIEPTYVSNPAMYNRNPTAEKVITSEKSSTEEMSSGNLIYSSVSKPKPTVQFSSEVVAIEDDNTKF